MGAEVSSQAVCNCGPLIALAGINQLALASMRAHGYYLSDRLVEAICRAAGEGLT